MGRTFQHIRLRSKGPTKEGGPVERHHRRILHRRFARRARRIQVDAQRRDILRHPFGCYRRRLDRFQPHDGRQHQARGSPTTTHRRRCITKWRPCPARVNISFDIMAQKWEFIISRRSAWVGTSGCCLAGLHLPRQIWAVGVRTLLSFVLYLVSYRHDLYN
jgi:hypothetical protein